MKKLTGTEIALYLVVGLVYLLGYYFLMIEFFKVDPFRGIYIAPTIYMIICYILFPRAGKIVSEKTADKKAGVLLGSKLQLLLAYIVAPYIVLLNEAK